MKTQGKIIGMMFAALTGAIVFSQCADSNHQTSDSSDSDKSKIEQEYAEAKKEVKDAFTPDEKQKEQPKTQAEKDKALKEEFADINKEFKEAFVALGETMEHEFNNTQQKLAVDRLERISQRLENRTDRLQEKLDEENKTLAAADELAKLKAVQVRLDLQVQKVKSASDKNWNDVRKDTKETCKKANDDIAEQVDDIQEILASK